MMLRFVTLLLLILSLVTGYSVEARPRPGHHRPRYSSYKHRGDARKRWRRMGVIGRWRYHKRFKKKQQMKGHRGVIKVGRPQVTMPKH
ncbi:hypothetical protein [Hymenobacter sp. BRD67]|uniref:hypothetical protein n=1 Tax=Hymenobacter sp. BRD67 TaxID=2675877 RepID=UPI0015656D8E|nr:hypothetical protein [Hymenobacter sp. BRD67]QKG54547.1 hypothetical protein GKZ67_20560 [Hymenobacter sp. BRD67]